MYTLGKGVGNQLEWKGIWCVEPRGLPSSHISNCSGGIISNLFTHYKLIHFNYIGKLTLITHITETTKV